MWRERSLVGARWFYGGCGLARTPSLPELQYAQASLRDPNESPGPPRRATITARLTAGGLALATLATPIAHAGDWGLDRTFGLYGGYQFGGGQPGHFSLALEARAVYWEKYPECGYSGEPRTLTGGVARLALVGRDQLRLALGPLVARTRSDFGAGVEFTAVGRLGRDRGLHAELAGNLDVLRLFNPRLAYAFSQDWGAGLSLRFPMIPPPGGCAIGRPVRRETGPLAPAGAIVIGHSTDVQNGADPARFQAARAWLERAQMEWASVPSFYELADQLLASGAPDSLVRRAHHAAADEIRHAVLSGQIAQALGGWDIILDPPVRDRRVEARGREGLCRLVLESWLDGCLGEGHAAALAALEAEATQFPWIRSTQKGIAVDESRHAALAWDILEWSLHADRAATRAVLARVVRDSSAVEDGVGTPPDSGALTFGVLGSFGAARVRRRHHADAHLRLQARVQA